MTWPRIARLMQEDGLYVLFVLLPFSKASVEIAFGVMFCGWVLERLHPTTRRDTLWLQPRLRSLALAVVGFLVACALSVAVSDVPRLSLRAFFSKWMEYVLFFVIAADVCRRPGVAGRCLWALLLGSAAVVLEGVWQERTGYGLLRGYRLDFFRRMTGPYENPIDLATYLMVVVPPMMLWAIAGRTRGRWLRWGWLLVLMLCLGRAGSVGAWLGLGFGVLVVGLRSAAIRRISLLVLLVALVIGGAFLLRTGRLSTVTSLSDIGKRDRVSMWLSAVAMVQDRPLFGHGLNTFMAIYLDYWVGGEFQPRYAHNCYLQIAAETGLVGLGAFLAFLWQLFTICGARAPTSSTRMEALFLTGLFGSLAAFAAHAAIDTDFYALRQAALFWTLAGLAVGWRHCCESRSGPGASDGASRPLAEPAFAAAASGSHV